ncbi:DUF1648 domain-containing protein [Saliphagus sp. LR7]|uniref:DUF1648 domain-containing protein n=1 Tax=Saliphagus sp. LR7 TaxID=2282654 RepID=UPI0013001B83|nr:DUF1648 domain-containing protein [Saliphagus sp. LR7]
MLHRRADRIGLGIIGGVTVVGLVLVPRLPAEVAIHFTAGGTPDNYVPRLVAVFSVPGIALATILLIRGAARLDPPTDPRSIDAVIIGMASMLSAIYLLVLAWNLGYTVSMSLVAAGTVLCTIVLASYVVLRETAE